MKIFEGRTEGTIVSPPRGKRDFGYVAPLFLAVFHIRVHSVADPGCLSRIRNFPSQISVPNFFSSRIRIKEFKYFNSKNCFRKYDPGYSTGIRILIFYPSRSRIQGSKWHRIPDPDLQHCESRYSILPQCGSGSRFALHEDLNLYPTCRLFLFCNSTYL